MLKNVFSLVILAIQPFVSQRNFWLVHSFPDFDDTTRALVESGDTRVEKWIVLSSGPCDALPEWLVRDDCIVRQKWSVAGIYYYLRSSVILFTHGLYNSDIFHPRCKTVVNVWHGMPLKNVGRLDPLTSNKPAKSEYAVATSALFRPIMAKAFDLSLENILITGIPRNDLLARPCDENKFFVWLPTYRRSVKMDVRTDGTELSGFFGLAKQDLLALDSLCVAYNFTIMLKTHPMDSPGEDVVCQRIIRISDEDLCARGETLYSLLSRSSGLITDASSVFFDYWLTERPIFNFFPDLLDYKGSRGFTIDLDFQRVFEDFFCTTGAQLLQSIERYVTGQLEWRQAWNEHGFHDFRYGSTDRLITSIVELRE